MSRHGKRKRVIPREQFLRAALNQKVRDLTKAMQAMSWSMKDCEDFQKWLDKTTLSIEKMKAAIRAQNATIPKEDLPS